MQKFRLKHPKSLDLHSWRGRRKKWPHQLTPSDEAAALQEENAIQKKEIVKRDLVGAKNQNRSLTV